MADSIDISPKPIKVTIAFDDGSSMSLSGKEAQEWKDAVNAVIALQNIHGGQFPKFNWVTTESIKLEVN